jgi:hypothetical protein
VAITATTLAAREALAGYRRRADYVYPAVTPALPVRKGARVLSLFSDGAGVGYVEGETFYGNRRFPVVRWSAEGIVSDRWDARYLVVVDAGTVLVEDQFNNVNRLCTLPLQQGEEPEGRVWRVVAAVSRGRYLVAHLRTSRVRVVEHRSMSNLY